MVPGRARQNLERVAASAADIWTDQRCSAWQEKPQSLRAPEEASAHKLQRGWRRWERLFSVQDEKSNPS
jgi:hypothetical protein